VRQPGRDLRPGRRRAGAENRARSRNSSRERFRDAGDHQLARDVTAQFTLGWDWQQAIPDRSTGFFGAPTLSAARTVALRDAAVLTAALACEEDAGGCGAASDATLLLVARVENFGDAVARGTVTVNVAGLRAALVPYFVPPGESVDLRTRVNASDVALWWPRGATDRDVALHTAAFTLGDETTRVVFGGVEIEMFRIRSNHGP